MVVLLIMEDYGDFVSHHGRFWWFCWPWKIMTVLLIMEDYGAYVDHGRL